MAFQKAQNFKGKNSEVIYELFFQSCPYNIISNFWSSMNSMYLGSRDMCRLRELEQHLMELDLDLNRTEHTSWQEYLRGKKGTTRKICQIGQNELFVSTAISKMASLIVLLFGNLNQVRNC